ncbi:hypothetical protein M0805_007264 [Coniferiporia weirii]|nr:hypothetical protein M0805_007264 [Coniferiporia weirii]
MSLDTVPPEILEHIAFFAATEPLLGPPAVLPVLLALDRSTHAALALATNPLLYARICAAKFDLTAPARRLAARADALAAPVLAAELVKRCRVLKRLRSLVGARAAPSPENGRDLDELLWTVFLMVLEDDGCNAAQLRVYARAGEWLRVYWFDDAGASGAMLALQHDRWPVFGLGAASTAGSTRGARDALAMWLLWFFLEPAAYVADPDHFRRANRLLKFVALNAPAYPLTRLPWTSFVPEPSHIHFGTPNTRSDEPINPFAPAPASPSPVPVEPLLHFGVPLTGLAPPPGAAPATLAYLALAARCRRDAHDSSIFGLTIDGSVADLHATLLSAGGFGAIGGTGGSDDAFVAAFSNLGLNAQGQVWTGWEPGVSSLRWEYEWRRSVCPVPDGEGNVNGAGTARWQTPALAFRPGSLAGVWEGSFTYTEFHSFAALLAGASPSRLRDCVLAQHGQTWRVREHHLLAPSGGQESDQEQEQDTLSLPAGDPILGHMPVGATVIESDEGLNITLPTATSSDTLQPVKYTYQRYNKDQSEGIGYDARVRDVILTGDGHSGWGEFRLVGRVRPYDGFVSVMKEYTGGDRGRWLYRGYLVGGGGDGGEEGSESEGGAGSGYLVGRWRDTLTPAETHGYEGAFALARRR